MIRGSSRSRDFFKKLVVNGVNNSKTQSQNNCLMRLYDADAELKAISSELDSFDGKKDPIRCNLLVNQLRSAQDKVISLLFQLMDDCNCERASRDYRMKFPDEILLSEGSESLNGQIWFGAECLSAGSNILNHTKESTMLRPMAKTLTTQLDSLRNDLRDLISDGNGAERINQALIKKMITFDHIFATFEYEYVRTMLPIRTVTEIEKLQEVAVLFSETLIDCVKRGLVKQEDIDEFQPIVMIAIPRLAIVRGLLYKNENPIYTRHKSQMCNLFQPFHGPLHSIRRLLRGLTSQELFSLEKMLSNDQSASESPNMQTRSKSLAKDKSGEPSLDSDKGDNSCVCSGESEASTSNNYSNVLMDGLRYPVGQKTVDQTQNGDYHLSDTSPDDGNYNCCFDAPSSSKLVGPPQSEHSPVGSSPATSSSLSSIPCKVCTETNDECENDLEQHGCQKGCCLSPPESESQLDKLVAEFDPSMNSQGPVQGNNDDAAPYPINNDQNQANAICKQERENDEALLQQLFIKQAQQLLHRLFVAISGVADQLQSNFASDLRFILRHIFSSEIDGSDGDLDENDDDDGSDSELDHHEYIDNDHSDSSLPIEQGIEAQEVENLIDLNSGYTVNPYDCDLDIRYTAQVSGDFPYINDTYNVNMSGYSAGSPLYTTIGQNSRELTSANSRLISSTLGQEVSDDILADLMRAADQSELLYDSASSPNETSIMDERRRQHLVQYIQSSSRAMNRASSRTMRHGSASGNSSGQQTTERRSRHHGHGGSRSRRPRGPPVWVPDSLVVACSCCNASFTLFRRRHHCRACGQIFCSECSKFTKNLSCWGYTGPVRVCESCFNQP